MKSPIDQLEKILRYTIPSRCIRWEGKINKLRSTSLKLNYLLITNSKKEDKDATFLILSHLDKNLEWYVNFTNASTERQVNTEYYEFLAKENNENFERLIKLKKSYDRPISLIELTESSTMALEIILNDRVQKKRIHEKLIRNFFVCLVESVGGSILNEMQNLTTRISSKSGITYLRPRDMKAEKRAEIYFQLNR